MRTMKESQKAPWGSSMTPVKIERRYWSIQEVSDYTGIAKGTLYNMVSERRIPYTKLGRLTKFDRYELDRWTKAHSVKESRPLAS